MIYAVLAFCPEYFGPNELLYYVSAGLVFTGCVLAYKTRDLDPKFGEAKQLGKYSRLTATNA